MKTKPIKFVIVSGWMAALFVGCSSIPSVGPNYKERELQVESYALPDAGLPTTNLTEIGEYEAAKGADDTRVVISTNTLAHWWKRFNDPVLVRLISGGVENNLGYRMAKERLSRAQYELLGSYAAFLPKFGVNADWARRWNSENTTAGKSTYNIRDFAVDGRWEIDIFGGNRRLAEAAFAEAEAANWTVSDAWISLTTQIGAQYINLRTTQELIDVARTNLVLQSETYEILKSRLDSGIGDELAVNQCAYIVEQTRARIPTLLSNEESIKNALAIWVGQYPGSLDRELAPLNVKRDWLLEPQKVSELPLDLIRSRPDVRAAERALAAQTARIGVAKAEWFPKLMVTGTLGWQNKSSTRLFSRDSFLASLGPAVSWPIFQGGAIYANIKAQEARTEELALAYEEAVQKAYEQVRNAYVAYTQEYHRYKALACAVKAATDAVQISQDLYKNGLKDFNNVLDAQRSRLDLEEKFVLSRGEITQNLISLYRALGGGLAAE